MSLIEWSDDYSVKVREMDDQHKKLVGMINDLHDAMKTGKGKDAIEKILNGLADYVDIHFSAEENLMKTHGFPEYLKQKAKHDELTKQVQDFKSKFHAGESVLTVEVMSFLKDWLLLHIKGMDKKYGPFLNSKGIS